MLIQRLQGNVEKELGIYYEFDVHSKPIGVGGMGKVYLGSKVIEESGKKTPVAIKAMYEDLPEHIIERAKREASIQIKHENLVEMLGFAEKEDFNSMGRNVKHYHVISEYINGVSLSDVLNGMTKNQFGVELESAKKLCDEYNRDKLRVSIRIIGQVLSAIMALHDNGYIHRDIDPSNIMITAKGTVKLIDFGIAKRLSTLGSQDKMLTSTGMFIGKAQYAAPELVTGDVRHQDTSTDIYSIGILFYQLLVGDLPFKGSIPEILDAQLHKRIPLKNIDNGNCRDIVKKATEKKQVDRYRSAAEFRAAIDGIKLDGDNKKIISLSLLALSTIILLMIVIRIITSSPHPKKDTDTIKDTDTTLVSPIVHIKSAINPDITDIYELSEFDYEELWRIANIYHSHTIVSEDYIKKGKYLLNTIFGRRLLQSCDNNMNYSNIKVAFILYAELQSIYKSNNDKANQNKCEERLKSIEKTSTLRIKE